MFKKVLFLLALFMGLGALAFAQPAADPRYIENGYPIHANGYIDMPYTVVLPDGTWLCTFTTGKLEEGLDGQHIAATRSHDLGHTWSAPVAIEPALGPAASWAMPYLTDFGRVYVFYVYNASEISELKGEKIRNDILGWYCFRYSDDGGNTWSERHRLPLRLTDADRRNDWEGQVQIFWGIGKPLSLGQQGMLLAFTKIGKYMLDQGEGWFFLCSNINSERDPSRLNWQLLPDGETGVRNPAFGSVQEEHNIVALSDGSLYCAYRTQTGHLAASYSRDGGHTWSLPQPARYADGRPVKTPRACARIWKCSNGRYLLWFHNHSGDHFSSRNPAWLAGGQEQDGEIRWSPPEIFLYGDDHSYESGRFSYPDLVEQDGRCWITETNKLQARIHEIPPSMLDNLWNMGSPATARLRSPVMAFSAEDLKNEKLPLSGFPKHPEGGLVLLNAMRDTGGLTIRLSVQPKDFSQGRVLLDTRNDLGSGLFIQTTGYRQLELNLCNTEYCETWSTDPGLLDIVRPHEVSFIFDNGPDIVLCVVDGQLCDGGNSRQFGWKHISPFLGQVLTNKKKEMRLAPEELKSLKIYDRAMSVREARH